MAYPYPDENTFWRDYEQAVGDSYREAGRQFPDPNDPAAYRWFSRCGYDCNTMPADQAAAKHLRGLREALGLTPPAPEPEPGDRFVVPVRGYVRTGTGWRDDSGPRSFRIASWFPALRCFRDNPDGVRRELDTVARYWQGLRVFWHLGTDYWVSAGYDVNPRWPDFDQVFTGFLWECQQRGLRVSLSAGDMQVICPRGSGDNAERDLYRRIAELAASVDPQTVSWFGIVNEGWQNCANREDPAYWSELSRIVQSVYPWGAHGLSDPFENEEPPALDDCSRPPANFTLVHGTRDWPTCMNRCFNLVYEGHWLLNQDEPTGPGPDVYIPTNDPRRLFGLYTLALLTRQMLTYFGGHGLKSWRQPGDLALDWGFRELPERWTQMQLPEDLEGYAPVPGHRSHAAIYPATFQNPHGSGPHRCDGVQSDEHAYFVVSAGAGSWDLRSRWDADVTIWRPDGPQAIGPVSADGPIPTGGPDEQAIVVESLRR